MTRSAVFACWTILLSSAFIGPIFGQEAPTGQVTYAEGDEFLIVRRNQPVRYTASPAAAEGVQLLAGDYVITEDGTTIEVRLGSGGAVVQVLENTSLEISDLDATGRAVLTIDYGRLRLITTGADDSDAVTIVGPHVVAQAGAARAAYGVTVRPDSAGGPTTEVECIDGSLRLESRDTVDDESDGDQPDRYVVLQRNQAFEVATSATIAAGTKRRLTGAERSAWEQVDVLGSGAALAQADEGASLPAPREETAEAADKAPTAPDADTQKPQPELAGGEPESDDQTPDLADTQELAPADADETEGGFVRSFVLETGVEAVAWGLTPTDMNQFASLGGGAGWLANLALILLTIRVGPAVDLMYEPAPFFRVGVGTGIFTVTWGEGRNETIPFLVPANLITRFSLGPVFLQPFAGVQVSGAYALATQDLSASVGASGGAELGLRLGRVTLVANAGVVFPTFEALTSLSFLYQFGLGGSYRFNF